MPDINTDSFTNELNAAAAKVTADYEQFVRRVCFDFFNVIRARWAKDTGWSVNNWHIQAGSPDKTVYPDKPGKQIVHQTNIGDFSYRIEDGAIYITNNVHYAEHLELSPTIAWGKKPNPYQGTVRIALTEFEDLMRKYAAGGTP